MYMAKELDNALGVQKAAGTTTKCRLQEIWLLAEFVHAAQHTQLAFILQPYATSCQVLVVLT